MSTQTDQDDPEVQQNGFRAMVEAVDLDPEVLEGSRGGASFFEDHFDPTDSFEANRERFFDFVRGLSGLRDEVEEAIDDLEDQAE